MVQFVFPCYRLKRWLMGSGKNHYLTVLTRKRWGMIHPTARYFFTDDREPACIAFVYLSGYDIRSGPEWLWQRPTTGNSNMADKTGSTYTSRTTIDSVHSPTANLRFSTDKFKESVPKWLRQQPTTENSNMAAQTGYPYSSGDTRYLMIKYTPYTDMEWQ